MELKCTINMEIEVNPENLQNSSDVGRIKSNIKTKSWTNDIICCICCFRGKGPLKNTSDVINAAKKIAEAGSRMDKLARAVADQVISEEEQTHAVWYH